MQLTGGRNEEVGTLMDPWIVGVYGALWGGSIAASAFGIPAIAIIAFLGMLLVISYRHRAKLLRTRSR
jgi:hypothetical protein